MQLEPVVRRSASQGAFDQLIDRLLRGPLAPGDPLPAERSLTEMLGVNRQAVREALQRLSQAGLIQISQGEPTRALDYRATGGLDLLPHLLVGPDGPNVEVGRAVMEMRACIGPDVARRAASRSGPDITAEIASTVEEMRSTTNLDDLIELDLRFWDLLVAASDNIAYRLAFNSMRSAYEPLAEILGRVLEPELTDIEGHAAVCDAITRGDGSGAADAAARLLARGTEAITTFLAQMSEGGEA